MSRKKGSFEYGEEAEKYILPLVGVNPQTTNAITKIVKERVFKKIHHRTVMRILDNLHSKGRIKKIESGVIVLWSV